MLPFDRLFIDATQRFKTIGGGALGGKARGLAIANSLLSAKKFTQFEVSIPSLTVLCADVFDEFIERNGLAELRGEDLDDDAIARAFQKADLPVRVVGDLRALIDEVNTPLAVRSSSLLEDELAKPLAGVYRTKMIPNHQTSVDDRFRRLVEAIKYVYASTWFREARGQDDRMAVILQEVVGTRHRDRFYPHVSGVARSWNYYPSGHASPREGVVDLALGLGKTIVEGGVCWTYSPAWPTAPAPFDSAADVAAGTQREFWAVNMGRNPMYDPIRETEYLVRGSLAEAEEDGTLQRIASTFDPASGQIRMGMGTSGARVLDFAPLLALREPPLNDVVRSLLTMFEDELQAAVEIEFAMTFDPHRFGFLQVRPMNVSSDSIEVGEDELTSGRAIVASPRVLGNGSRRDVTDIVYVKPTDGRLDTRAIAADLAVMGRGLENYLLIGFGRWGSSDPSLGIPVVWTDILGTAVLVEAMRPHMNVEPSQGSHFFHNLAGAGVPIFTVPLSGRATIDWGWIESQPVVAETERVRHVRCAAPLEIRVDGRSGRGVILRPQTEGE